MILNDLSAAFLPFVGIGFLIGCVPLVLGLFLQFLINLLKRV